MKIKKTIQQKKSEGFVTYEVLDVNKKVIEEGSFTNLVMDAYYDTLDLTKGDKIWLGTGTAAPNKADTDLDEFFIEVTASTSDSNQVGYSGGASGEIYKDRIYSASFTTAIHDVAISEIGVAEGVRGVDGKLLAKSLIKNSAGEPEAITISEGQTLNVTYRLRAFIPRIYLDAPLQIPSPWEAPYDGTIELNFGSANARDSRDFSTGDYYGQIRFILVTGLTATATRDDVLRKVTYSYNRTNAISSTDSPFYGTSSYNINGDVFKGDNGRYGISVLHRLVRPDNSIATCTVPANHNLSFEIELTIARPV